MTTRRKSIHGEWSSRLAFILAATGSAVGLGNIWKFPYITGENGGGAFVIVYLGCIALIGIPVMIAEIMLGRRGRQSPINTMRSLAEEEGKSKLWQLLGWAGMVAGFIILSYYSVIAGWALAYVFRVGSGAFQGATSDGVQHIFVSLVSDPERILAWHTIFMVMTIVVVARGVQSGLEKAVRFLMPTLFILLLMMLGYAMNTGSFEQGLHFMFDVDFKALFYPDCTPERCEFSAGGVLTALGHAFFTLSLGMGAIMVYGSYLSHTASIAKMSFAVAIMDTVVALIAGLAIFPIVFANGLAPGAGPGLIFQTLPLAFGHMPLGTLFGTLFFVLLVFAAWSSAISLIEPAVAWLVENHGMRRTRATTLVGLLIWLLGIITVLSFNKWSFSFEFLGQKKSDGLFDVFDILTANFMLPLGGLFISIFAVWVMSKESSRAELAIKYEWLYGLWRFIMRYITPVAIIAVFLNVTGLLGYIA